MSIVNFAIPKSLEHRVKSVIRKKGFPSKAEFFRFTAIHYLDEIETLPLDKNPRIVALSEALERELLSKIGSKPLPSAREQLQTKR